jgi:hypothetical protein
MPAALLGHGRLELDAGALSSRDNPTLALGDHIRVFPGTVPMAVAPAAP